MRQDFEESEARGVAALPYRSAYFPSRFLKSALRMILRVRNSSPRLIGPRNVIRPSPNLAHRTAGFQIEISDLRPLLASRVYWERSPQPFGMTEAPPPPIEPTVSASPGGAVSMHPLGELSPLSRHRSHTVA
jgi:hypothetical protein